MNHLTRMRLWLAAAIVGSCATTSALPARANGVSDDRVSLPDGPGSISGVGENLEIDPNMGQMRYSLSVSLPAGHPSATPDLTLTYGSGGGASVVGIGWSLPIASIERATVRGLPSYTADDRFVADASGELVAIGGGMYRARFGAGPRRQRRRAHGCL